MLNGISVISNYSPGGFSGGGWTLPSQYAGYIHADTNLIRVGFTPADLVGRYTGFGISLQNMVNPIGFFMGSLSGVGSVNTIGNTIKDAYNGIFASCYMRQVVNTNINDIRLRGAVGAKYCGINHTYCSKNNILNNTVTGTDAAALSNTGVRAYYVANCQKPLVGCNNAKGTYKGFEFFQQNPGTRWIGNTMDQHNYGMVLNGALIGQQGGPSSPIHDQWSPTFTWGVGGTYQTAVFGTPDATNSRLYVWSSDLAVEKPISNFPPSSLPGYDMSLTDIQTTYGSMFYLCHPLPHTPGTGMGGLEPIATKGMTYTEDSVVRTFIGQLGAWQYVVTDSDALCSSAILDTFVAYSVNSRYLYLGNIENALISGDTATANWYLNNPPTPLVDDTLAPPFPYYDSITGVSIADDSFSTYIVDNYRAFYTLFENYTNNYLSATDSAAIIYMAGLCPATYGTVVYQTRSLYAAVFGILQSWNDDSCGYVDTSGSRQGRFTKNSNGVYEQRYQLFPNPNKGSFTMQQYKADNSPNTIRIWNVLGNCIYDKNITFVGGTFKIQLEGLIPGIYSLDLIDSKGGSYPMKFVVQ